MIFDLQRYSTHDGPGIRTLVFLKGCSLACLWCQNPESRSPKPDILLDRRQCIEGCQLCSQACPAILHDSEGIQPTSPTSPPRPSGRRCSSATLSSSSCRSNPTVTRCRLAGWISTSTPGIAARWNCRNPCLGRAPSNCCKGAGSKLLEVNKIRSGTHSKASAGSPLYQNVTIGGQNWRDGAAHDAVNGLSYAILESCGQLRSTQPNLSVRYHAGMSEDFLDACIQVIRCGFGMPAFNNDEVVIPEFIKLGVSVEDAHHYAAIGCIETAVPGKWGYRCTGMSFINFARILLASLDGGRDATTGKVFLPQPQSLRDGSFGNFDEVMARWDEQVRYFTRKSIEIDCVVDSVLEAQAHDILCSTLVDDCIERGKTIKEGGAVYDWVSGLQVGIANLGNSLAALKKLVFEQGIVDQQELAEALEQDFSGLAGEQLRQRLTNAAPKYGNDLDEVDLLLVQAYQSYIDELKGLHNTRFGRGPIGGTYYAGTSSISANVPFGAATMATPDGRHARTPLAEGASPSSGSDRLGPTAVFNSIGKLPTAAILGGVLLNQKLSPASLENERDKTKLMSLLRTFFEVHKGWHVQYNIVSRETLLAAKANPDQYRDLVVRVAGYSAFFTALSPDAQDDIIARTEHSL